MPKSLKITKRDYTFGAIGIIIIVLAILLYHHGYFGFSIAVSGDDLNANPQLCLGREPFNPSVTYPIGQKMAYEYSPYIGSLDTYIKLVHLKYYNGNLMVFEEMVSYSEGGSPANLVVYANQPDQYVHLKVCSECTPNWQCGEWSVCMSDNQQRTCLDGCGNERVESQACSSGGNGGSGEECPDYFIPSCQFYESQNMKTDSDGCPYYLCELSVHLIGIIILIFAALIAVFLLKKKG